MYSVAQWVQHRISDMGGPDWSLSIDISFGKAPHLYYLNQWVTGWRAIEWHVSSCVILRVRPCVHWGVELASQGAGIE